MRGLRKYLAPFAPDQSGASAVLSDLGGIIVICDAGGCAGNICGFDEPRWFMKKSAIFSAGLRDMDAIMGRDDRLVEKLVDAASKIEAGFAAIIGTPVPAVIGTDYHALKRMAAKKTHLPVLAIDTNGMELYDVGEEKTWLALFRTFATEQYPVEAGSVGIIGATPLEIHSMNAPADYEAALKTAGYHQIYCYGMGAGTEEIKKASAVEKNLVIAPCALKTAQYLEEKFGTPYEIAYPAAGQLLADKLAEQNLTVSALFGKKILIMHQQVLANAVREEIRSQVKADCTVASWFMLKPQLCEAQDLYLMEEDQFTELLEKEQYDVIIGDDILKNAAKGFQGIYVNLPHFAVSGKV
ncbi:MAG: nitrogenase component 1 [Lachnospiraceae bacterium]|nr:nitrogenase component 1 [Lachnospiraceae bacterium]